MRVSRVLVCLFVLVSSVNLFADAPRTWVSGTGDDGNPCTYTAPCRTFMGAYPKTMVGGEITVKDVAAYGPITISKSITIEGGSELASISFGSGSGITVDFPDNDGYGNTVVIRGLKMFSTLGTGYGIFMKGSVPTHLHVIDTTVTHATAAMSVYAPAGSSVSLDNVEASHLELVGFLIEGIAGKNPLKLSMNNVRVSQTAVYAPWGGVRIMANTSGTISNSSFRNGFHGVTIEGADVKMNVVRTVMADNYGNGLNHEVANISTAIDGCSIFNNAYGVSNVGGTVGGFTNNAIFNNQTDVFGNPVKSLLGQ